MAPAVVIGALLQTVVYAFVIIRAGRSDWSNLALVSVTLSLVPFAASALLVSLHRHYFPITTAVFLSFIVFNFAVALLSALRIPISYSGLLYAAPFATLSVIYASIRYRQAREDHVAILPFPGAEALQTQLGGNAFILTDPLASLEGVDRVLIDGQTHHSAEWSKLLTRLHMLGIEVTPWFRFLEMRFGRVDVDSFDIFHLAFSSSQIYYSKAKRIVDVTAVVVLAPIAVPLCLLIAAYIWALDGGPVVFRQRRRGYCGSEFTMLKFRTMRRNAGDLPATADDRRIIRGCRFLRQMRLDELPQMINILRGDMSWIGPRPVAVQIANALESSFPQYSHRHLVLPGITGWAQVSRGYASTRREEIEKLAYDLFYVKELSFDLDLLILAKTIRIVLFRIGAK